MCLNPVEMERYDHMTLIHGNETDFIKQFKGKLSNSTIRCMLPGPKIIANWKNYPAIYEWVIKTCIDIKEKKDVPNIQDSFDRIKRNANLSDLDTLTGRTVLYYMGFPPSTKWIQTEITLTPFDEKFIRDGMDRKVFLNTKRDIFTMFYLMHWFQNVKNGNPCIGFYKAQKNRQYAKVLLKHIMSIGETTERLTACSGIQLACGSSIVRMHKTEGNRVREKMEALTSVLTMVKNQLSIFKDEKIISTERIRKMAAGESPMNPTILQNVLAVEFANTKIISTLDEMITAAMVEIRREEQIASENADFRRNVLDIPISEIDIINAMEHIITNVGLGDVIVPLVDYNETKKLPLMLSYIDDRNGDAVVRSLSGKDEQEFAKSAIEFTLPKPIGTTPSLETDAAILTACIMDKTYEVSDDFRKEDYARMLTKFDQISKSTDKTDAELLGTTNNASKYSYEISKNDILSMFYTYAKWLINIMRQTHANIFRDGNVPDDEEILAKELAESENERAREIGMGFIRLTEVMQKKQSEMEKIQGQPKKEEKEETEGSITTTEAETTTTTTVEIPKNILPSMQETAFSAFVNKEPEMTNINAEEIVLNVLSDRGTGLMALDFTDDLYMREKGINEEDVEEEDDDDDDEIGHAKSVATYEVGCIKGGNSISKQNKPLCCICGKISITFECTICHKVGFCSSKFCLSQCRFHACYEKDKRKKFSLFNIIL
jgi:hypothetical protein